MKRPRPIHGPRPWFGPINGHGHFQQGWVLRCVCGEDIKTDSKPSMYDVWDEHLKTCPGKKS